VFDAGRDCSGECVYEWRYDNWYLTGSNCTCACYAPVVPGTFEGQQLLGSCFDLPSTPAPTTPPPTSPPPVITTPPPTLIPPEPEPPDCWYGCCVYRCVFGNFLMLLEKNCDPGYDCMEVLQFPCEMGDLYYINCSSNALPGPQLPEINVEYKVQNLAFWIL